MILISAFARRSNLGTGLLQVNGDTVEIIDDKPTTGLYWSPSRKLSRVLWSYFGPTTVEIDGQLILLDGVGNVHDISWDGPNLVIVDPDHDRVVWFDLNGTELHSWSPQGSLGEGDSCHLASLAWHEEVLYVTTFGIYNEPRGWAGKAAIDKRGALLEVGTGREVISGLATPHTPRRWRDGWLLCESVLGDLVYIPDELSRNRNTIQLGGWCRGVLVDGDTAYVAVSAPRGPGRPPAVIPARLVHVDLVSGIVLSEVELPVGEAYDVVPWLE